MPTSNQIVCGVRNNFLRKISKHLTTLRIRKCTSRSNSKRWSKCSSATQCGVFLGVAGAQREVAAAAAAVLALDAGPDPGLVLPPSAAAIATTVPACRMLLVA